VEVARESCGDAVAATVETLTFDAPSYTGYRKKTPKYYPSWVFDADYPLVAETKRIVDEMLGGDAEIGRWTFSTSGTCTMGVAEIPTVGFGPSQDSYAHTTWDQVEVDDVGGAAAMYAALGLEL
jgi:acetylornithine deacetylase/succinyl-diaminopimelate desuccinylase-like protein